MDPVSIDNVVRVLLGCTALLAGRNIFWLFIAVIGFLLGFELAHAWLAGQPIRTSRVYHTSGASRGN